ncbi:hypothetical protein pclt_cds_721 [Pandoravirus celtis]|uniref:Ankyrin repeat domain containing protein n=1 Tax=Pandoravirus celtis TaxID=2568002 RepID=A0A4D6EIH2_9VIRU|nr:hypothetical protein pclt_cds_721 [Pandoravirus celtis]
MAGMSLLDLPAEIVSAIVNLLGHPRDVAACICATPALAYLSPVDTAASHYRGRSEAALAAGLPLDVVRALFARWTMAPQHRHLPAAACGGRADVVRWVCSCVAKEDVLSAWTTVQAPTPVTGAVYVPGPDVPTVQPDESTDVLPPEPWEHMDATRRTAPGAALTTNRGTQLSSAGINDLAVHRYRLASPAPIVGRDQVGPVGGTRDPTGRILPAVYHPHQPPYNGRRAAQAAIAPVHRSMPVPAQRRQQAPPDSATGPLLLMGDARAVPYLSQAVCEAARLGHVDMLRYLTTACPLAQMPCALDVRVVVEAARQGTFATVMYAHDRWPYWQHSDRGGGTMPCCCPTAIGDAAVAGGQQAMLQWMRTVGCQAFPCTTEELARAVAEGNDRLVDAITSVIVTETHPSDPCDLMNAIGTVQVDAVTLMMATQQGHTRALAIAHARGFAPFTLEMLCIAAGEGHLDILRWAAGECVPCVEPCFAPSPGLRWDDPAVVWSAARRVELDPAMLDWFAARPETRCHFDAVMARTLLAHNRPATVLWMHDTGLVSLSSGQSLEPAIRGGVDCLDALVDRGAVCSPQAMAAALMLPHSADPIILLCQRFGYDDLYDAIRLHVRAVDNEAIRWVRDNVPGLCVDHIIRAGKAHTFVTQGGPPSRCRIGRQPADTTE